MKNGSGAADEQGEERGEQKQTFFHDHPLVECVTNFSFTLFQSEEGERELVAGRGFSQKRRKKERAERGRGGLVILVVFLFLSLRLRASPLRLSVSASSSCVVFVVILSFFIHLSQERIHSKGMETGKE